MELHAGDVPSLHDRRERLAVLGDRRGVAGDRRDVAVREVHLRPRLDAFEDRSLDALDREAVPADVRNLDAATAVRSEAKALPRQQTETPQVGRFVAAFEQPLHAEADAQERPAFADAAENRLDPRRIERARRAEV